MNLKLNLMNPMNLLFNVFNPIKILSYILCCLEVHPYGRNVNKFDTKTKNGSNKTQGNLTIQPTGSCPSVKSSKTKQRKTNKKFKRKKKKKKKKNRK